MPRDLRALPKAHLHLHFTGSMAAATLVDLAAARGIGLPESLTDAAVDRDPVRLPANERGWFRFQRMYDAARAVVTSEPAMRRVVDEAVAADAAEGSVRLELQVDPTGYAAHVGGITPALEIVIDAARAASTRHGIEVGIIVAASRLRHPLDANTLARLAVRHRDDGVVGFGLSNDERRGQTQAFTSAFRIARDGGLASVPHGGELLGPEHVDHVLTHLRPNRLGHGVTAAADSATLDRVVTAGVALEVCPTSNLSLGVFDVAEQVPLRRLHQAGAVIALGADDPLIFGARLVAQYQLARDLGFDDSELAELARGSIRASRASQASKTAMCAAVDTWLQTAAD